MGSVVLLRKLTNKSIMNFGKYFDLTVQQCLDTKKRKYLRWVYFNCSNITFTDELLDELLIPVGYRFDKPSKNVELGKKLEEASGWSVISRQGGLLSLRYFGGCDGLSRGI